MAAKMILAVLAVCVCAAYAGIAPAAIATYAHAAPLAHIAAPYAHTYAHAAPIAHTYAHAAPIAHTYAHAAPIAYAAAPILIDNTHFSYGYINPYNNGRVDVARNGPVGSHAYNFAA